MKRLAVSIAVAVAWALPSTGWSGATVAIQWPGVNVGFTQLDPHGAAGPSGIFETSNGGVSYYSKTGVRQWTTNEQGFFLPTVCCDAKALFDPLSQRFFVISQAYNSTADSASNLFVCVSKSSNPQSATTNDWWKYKLYVGIDIDYPGIGLDSQALYVSYGEAQKVIIVNKAHLLTNAPSPYVITGNTPAIAPDFADQGLQAVSVVGSQTPGDVAYFVTLSETNVITLTAITNPIGTHAALFVTTIAAPSVGNESLVLYAPQLGTTNRVNASMSAPTMGNAFWYAGGLWFCGVAASSNQPERTLVRYYKLKTDGYPFNTNAQVTLDEWGDLDGGTNTWRQHPSIGGNGRGDVCLVYTQSASNSLPTMYSSIRKAGDTSFSTVLVKASTTAWTHNDSWCDYSVVTPDPEDQTFWAAHIVITGPNSVTENWANITRDNLFYVDANAVGTEAGTRAQPFHTVRNAQTAASGAMTFVISPTNYPETPLPLLINKTVRLENPYPSGIVHLGP